jgi:nucleoside-diphosphate-sugar epimerase
VSRLALVTGATGFVGSHVMETLRAAGWRVRVPVRPTSDLRWVPCGEVECVPAELRDPDSLRALAAGAAWVLHFGGITRAARRADFFAVNTEGTRRLWQAARAAGTELFIYCSSLSASGPAPAADRPRRETDPPAPITPYGESKLEAERALLGSATGGPRILIVRPPAIYGPRDRAVLELFRWARHGFLPLPPLREARVSLVHGRDLAQACVFLGERAASGIFHVSDGGVHSWEEVGAIASQALKRRLRPLRVPAMAARLAGWIGESQGRLTGRLPVVHADKVRDILQPYWICDIGRLREAGYTPRIGLAQGILETVEWYQREGWL